MRTLIVFEKLKERKNYLKAISLLSSTLVDINAMGIADVSAKTERRVKQLYQYAVVMGYRGIYSEVKDALSKVMIEFNLETYIVKKMIEKDDCGAFDTLPFDIREKIGQILISKNF